MRLIEILTKMQEIGKQLKELEAASASEAHENMELYAILSKAYKFYEHEISNLGKGVIVRITARFRGDIHTVYYVNVTREVAELLFTTRHHKDSQLIESQYIPTGTTLI